MTNTLYIGQVVRNFGEIAKVVAFHEITGDPILRDLYNKGQGTWLADATKCDPLPEQLMPVFGT